MREFVSMSLYHMFCFQQELFSRAVESRGTNLTFPNDLMYSQPHDLRAI